MDSNKCNRQDEALVIILLILFGVVLYLIAVCIIIPNIILFKIVGGFCIGWCCAEAAGGIASWIVDKWNKD